MNTKQTEQVRDYLTEIYVGLITDNPRDWASWLVEQIPDEKLIRELDMGEDAERDKKTIEQLGFDPRDPCPSA